MANRINSYDDCGAAALENQPRYEKRRRPERIAINAPSRRAFPRSSRRSGATSYQSTGGFHRRIIKKPFYGIG